MSENEEKLTFEAAMTRLDEIVRQLERGDAALDASLTLFEEGTRLARFCDDALNRAEQRVTILMKQADGSVQEQRFSGENDDDAQ